jgi:hypothetical protein
MGLLSKLIGKPPTSRPPISDEVLGEIIFNSQDRLWQASVKFDGAYIYIGIDGGEAPAPVLLVVARNLARAAPGFRARLSEFLNAESTAHFSSIPNHEMYQKEIAALELDRLLLLFPNRPKLVSIVLSGGELGQWSVEMENDQFLALHGPE